jgi:hypothetical protein
VGKNEDTTVFYKSVAVMRKRLAVQLLIYFHIAACCVSLVFVAEKYAQYHIFFSVAGLPGAIAAVAAFALLSIFFVFAEFSFGYFIGFHFYTMIAGYLWLNSFSKFGYDHQLAGVSAAASLVALLLPALFIRSSSRQIWVPTERAFNRLLSAILLFSVATVAIGASYNFRLVAIDQIYNFRDNIEIPTILNYFIGMTAGVLLPFAFACFVQRADFWRAAATLFLLLLLYPITLSKLVLFTPAWLVAMALFSRIFELKITVILTLFVPVAVGVILFAVFKNNALTGNAATSYFAIINLRTIAFPSLAMDYYNEFFNKHELTYFCQIRLLKHFVSCAYQEPLAIIIYNAFGIGGYFNASLFATEGIASIGTLFAPVSAFVCGAVLAIGNRLSAGLPSRFVLISSAVLPHVLLNVPLTTTLLTHGAGVLFLLWYLTPRSIFEEKGRQKNYRRDIADGSEKPPLLNERRVGFDFAET